MKAVFELKEMKQDWQPPFQKKIETQKIEVEETESFDSDGNNVNNFTLLKILGGKALIEYHRDYAPKGYEHPANRCFWFERGETKSFTSLWKNNGTTKSLTLLEVTP